MSRSVYTPSGAVSFYIHLEDQDDYEGFIEGLQEYITEQFPEFNTVGYWCNREEWVIAQSLDACVSVCEYNGIVSINLTAPNGWNSFGQTQVDKFAKLIKTTFAPWLLTKLGTFSNGEAIFQLANQPGSCITSKEGQLW